MGVRVGVSCTNLGAVGHTTVQNAKRASYMHMCNMCMYMLYMLHVVHVLDDTSIMIPWHASTRTV